MMKIPMGTVMMLCMFITVFFATQWPSFNVNRLTPTRGLRLIGVITLSAGLWNAVWHALRHLTEFWGLMALGSGVLMSLLSILLILTPEQQPRRLNQCRPYFIVGLLGFAVAYAIKIDSL